MSSLTTVFAMGSYGAYVWPAYGLTALGFAAMLGWTLATLKTRRREEKSLAALGRPRGRTRA